MLMAKEDENPRTPSSSPLLLNTKNPQSPAQESILSLASDIASQPVQYSDPRVWGILTAVSDRARKRPQGVDIVLTSDEHCIGRLVDDVPFQILSNQISANHCRICRRKVSTPNADEPLKFCNSILLKDTSTNGTYINWEKLSKHSPGSKLHHGDIISFAAPPQHELAYAFVFRDVLKAASMESGSHHKRKAGKVSFCDKELNNEGKRVRAIGVSDSKSPISLDPSGSFQISKEELRKEVESQVIVIESLRVEIREATERHQTEKEDLKQSISKSYADELRHLNNILEVKQKELAEVNNISTEQKQNLEEINKRLDATLQSYTEANDIIYRHKESISELKALLKEERDQREKEREKATLDLVTSRQRFEAEAREELKRISDSALRKDKEQHNIIIKLQKSEEEKCTLLEILRSDLEAAREKSIFSEEKVCELESLLNEEKQTSANTKKIVEQLEKELRRLRKEHDNEKTAREEARLKVSILEREINDAIKNLDFERRRFRAARQRIVLRETQFQAFVSTTEEISTLFVKQQEQLKAMQKTLIDEDNYDKVGVNASPEQGQKSIGFQNPNSDNQVVQISSDEDSVLVKHEADTKIQENSDMVQEVESNNSKAAFGSIICGLGSTHVLEAVEDSEDREVADTRVDASDIEMNGGAQKSDKKIDDDDDDDTQEDTYE